MPLLLVLVLATVLPLVVAVMMLSASASPARLARFAQRHGLAMTPAGQEPLAAYLVCTRQWRTAGVLCAYVVTLIWMLPQQRIGVELVPLLAGWLAGSLIAELRFRALADSRGWRPAVGEVGPRWLWLVPLIIAAMAVASTLLIATAPLSAEGFGRTMAWGLGALVCAALVAVVNWRVAGTGAAEVGEAGPVIRAIKADATGAITGAGSALMLVCMIQQLEIVQSGLFGQTAVAVGGVATIGVLGALAIAWILRTAVWPSQSRPLRRLAVICAALVAGSASWAGYGIWRDHPPYGPHAVGATATVRLTTFGRFDEDARAMGITGLNPLLNRPEDQIFVGRVDFTVPAKARGAGTYHIVVIDKRTNTLAPQLFGPDGGGWGGFLGEVPKQYPWLSAMAPVAVNGGWTNAGMEIGAPSDTNSPMVFVGMFPGTTLSSPADLTVALIFSGPDQQIYWATPVTLNT